MAISRKAQDSAKTEYTVTVKRAKDFTKEGKNTTISFDMEVNGVTIYGCWYREYTSKEGKDGTMISFPSQQGKDGNYYNHAFFPMTEALKLDIEKQIESVL